MSLPPPDVPALLRQHHLRPSKGLGQNFLIDEPALAKVIRTAELTPQDVVLEIGAGLGSLTRWLAQSARWVVTVEVDPRLIELLRSILFPFSNVTLLQADILEVDPAKIIPDSDYLVVANIPYYITSAVFRHLLESNRPPRRIVLTVQREVASRICALPGEMSLLALSVQVYGQPMIAASIPAGAFYPPPKVDSAIVRVDLYPSPRIPAEDLGIFFQLIRAGFGQKRKTLRNALRIGYANSKINVEGLLTTAGIDPMRRAETLSLEEWGVLVAAYRLATGN